MWQNFTRFIHDNWVYWTKEDADDGDREATRNIGHGTLSLFSGWVQRTWNNCPAAVTSVTPAVPAGAPRPWARRSGDPPFSFLDRATLQGRLHVWE